MIQKLSAFNTKNTGNTAPGLSGKYIGTRRQQAKHPLFPGDVATLKECISVSMYQHKTMKDTGMITWVRKTGQRVVFN